ncbi:sodium:proton antiporter [Dethiosulfovibrio sp. F2B]|uniref:Na+/H+ antiporter NhaC family protein n=1 Tax=Dethiosulfovibrio faecalis TaxID=2720018 RepID=UPI001F36B88C|nr:Na+/H+ antiporter NhaC family protein [Dethiosulfovibrio faecalis]MCF4150893.1 sodium:proton antiporter [Dethiosulfovibrio faecalis]
MDIITLLLFIIALTTCIALDISILLALSAGYCIFFVHARFRGYSTRSILKMSLEGLYTVRNVVMILLLIGVLTALWRASGTIPAIVSYSSRLVKPSLMVLMTFLLNCLVSFLTGTAFGAAATMGVICMTMALSIGINPAIAGGAILSGIYFGDRCSPVSTSALLVAGITSTNLYRNIGAMMRSSAVPFLITCLIYAVAGFLLPHQPMTDKAIQTVFEKSFKLGWIPLLPAVIILIMSFFRINVRYTIGASVLCAAAIYVMYQAREFSSLPGLVVYGYRATDTQLAALMDGGGILSMLRVVAIVSISSSYAGIFEKTGLLNSLKRQVNGLADRISPFGAMLLGSVVCGVIACNQTLTIMLTHQICQGLNIDQERLALNLEDTAVLTAPLIPWTTAAAVPLVYISAPTTSILAACYLYLVPLWGLVGGRTLIKKGIGLKS